MSKKKRKSASTCPIMRSAREPAELAIRALRVLQAADPFVAFALRDLISSEEFVTMPRSAREEMRTVRLVAHEMKLRAVHKAAGVPDEDTKAAIARWHAEVL